MSSVPSTPTVTPLLAASDLKWYYSGGTFNSDPNESLGGEISATEHITGTLNGLFDRVDSNEAELGDFEYRCIYLKNTHVDRTFLGGKVWIEQGTPSNNTAINISVGAGGTNGRELKIPDENTPPTTQTFEAILTEPEVANIGDLGPGDYIAIWIQYYIAPGTTTINDELSVIRVDGEREPEPEQLVNPPPVTCPAGFHYVPATNSCVADPVTCPPGTHYVSSTNTCVPDSTNPSPVCPINWHYDAPTNTCIPNSTAPPTVPNVKFAIAGDWDCNTDTQATFTSMKQRLPITGAADQLGLIFPIGDFSYIDGNQACFIALCQSMGQAMFPNQFYPVIGNHEDVEDGTASDRTQIINAFPNLTANGWYAFTKGNIRFIGVDTQKSYAAGSAQHTFIMAELAAAAGNPLIKWKVVFYHKPSLISDTTHAALTDFRLLFHPAFDTYKVDLIFTGHAHVYFRSKFVKHNPANPAQPIIVTSTTTPPPPTGSGTSGELLYDSNIHGNWNNGVSRTVTGSEGSQAPNGKGFFTAASGSPRLIIDGDGTAHLEADAGHGRIYVKATNFNARLESDFKFETSSIDNSTWRLRSRHNVGGACSNRFGGFGFTIRRTSVGFATESCHNEHENSIDANLATPLVNNKWYRIAYECFNSVNNAEVNFKAYIDYKDGQGFKTVLTGKHTSPQNFYMDEATFMQESYFWLRINNSSTGKVAFKDLKLTKLAPGGAGGGTTTTTTTTTTNQLASPDGRTFITCGTAGRRVNHTFTGDNEPYVAIRTNTHFGAVFGTLQNNGTELKCEFIENTGQVIDAITLSKPGATPAPPTCPVGYHLEGTICLPDLPASCPPGQHLENGICVPDNPPPPTVPALKIGFVGDTPSGSVQQQIYANMATKGINQFCHVGDFTYSGAPKVTTDNMTAAFPSSVVANSMVALGNHDHPNEDGSQSTLDYMVDFFNLSLSNQYCSKKQIQNVFIIGMNSQDSAVGTASGTQYNFVTAALAEAVAAKAAGTVDWIIVIIHKPLNCAPSDHPQNEEGQRTIYQPIFQTNQVDFVVSGHNHLLEVSHPLSNSTTTQYTVTDQGYDFRQTHGQIYLLSGAGGRSRDSHSSQPAIYRYLNGGSYGYHLLSLDTSGKNMTVEVISNTGTTLHSFIVTKGTVVLPPPPAPCPTGQHRDPITGLCVPDAIPPGPGGGGGTIDSKGIKWFRASGQQGVIAQTRDTADDDRWSGNITGVDQYGYEVTMIMQNFSGVSSSGHFALKHWGPNHSAPCGYQESGQCCCFPAGYNVITSKGLKPIEQVKKGDRVYTHKGRYMKVLGGSEHFHTGDTYTIKTYGYSNYETTATHVHPFLTKDRGWVRAEDLTTKDWLMIPINKTVNDVNSILLPYAAKVSDSQQYYGLEIKLTLQNELLTVIGYYLAEGNLIKYNHSGEFGGVMFTFGSNELDSKHITDLFNSIEKLGFTPLKRYRNEYHTCTITFYSIPFATWLYTEFGHGAKNKHLPQWLIELPNEKTQIVLETYLNGDGYSCSKGKHNSRHVKSVSEDLLIGMRDIALRLGYKTSLRKQKIECGSESVILGRKVKINTPYELYLSKVTGHQYEDKNNSRRLKRSKDYGYKFNTKIRLDENYQYNKIRSIEKKPFRGVVYNIGVDEDHTYTVNNLIVSNCWYDTGIRSNGDVQLQIERPHPNNDNFSETLIMNNIGKGMNGNSIGLKWLVHPIIPGGTADNGGIHLMMWVDTQPMTGSLPSNNWRLVYDFIDSGQILGDYDPPSEHDCEVRNSGTSSRTPYGGGLHWKKRTAADFT